jgi:hypothetical protein
LAGPPAYLWRFASVLAPPSSLRSEASVGGPMMMCSGARRLAARLFSGGCGRVQCSSFTAPCPSGSRRVFHVKHFHRSLIGQWAGGSRFQPARRRPLLRVFHVKRLCWALMWAPGRRLAPAGCREGSLRGAAPGHVSRETQNICSSLDRFVSRGTAQSCGPCHISTTAHNMLQ